MNFLDKKTNAMNLTLTLSKIALVTVAAFISPWLVVPAFILAELASIIFEGTSAQNAQDQIETPTEVNDAADAPSIEETVLIIEKIEEPQQQEAPQKKQRKKRAKSSDDAPQQRTQKPKGKRK